MASITKRGNSYRIRSFAGYDHTGKQIERSTTWTPPAGMTERQAEKEALRQAILFEETLKSCEDYNTKIKFYDFANLWLTTYAECNLSPKTVTRYRGLLIRINESIGHLRLAKIQPTHLVNFYASLAKTIPDDATYRAKLDFKSYYRSKGLTQQNLADKTGLSVAVISNVGLGKNVSLKTAQKLSEAFNVSLETIFEPNSNIKPLAPMTILHYHRLISNILCTAVRWQYIPYNPADRLTPPKARINEALYLDDEEAKELVKLLSHEEGYYRRAVQLILLTGLRRGELLGLEWTDVNWDAKSLSIVRTSQYISGKGLVELPPKNGSSNRIIYVSDQVLDILRQQLSWQEQQATELGDQYQKCGRIITVPDGTPMNPDRLTRWFSRFIKKTNLPQVHIHSLRHTYATLCIANGAPITTVAAQLGHSTSSTTARIYAHAIQSSQTAVADYIGGLFSDVL